ncbi:hypothetical protein COCON_G00192360 [Conger conger]|uniref:Uncharacterized protein n=1 Tax=Conger conger TaxID=82655 RepID=A0A9Q1D4E7_CONCO|nr:hypothetical protein COCON_G00192360 [Conger conger]
MPAVARPHCSKSSRSMCVDFTLRSNSTSTGGCGAESIPAAKSTHLTIWPMEEHIDFNVQPRPQPQYSNPSPACTTVSISRRPTNLSYSISHQSQCSCGGVPQCHVPLCQGPQMERNHGLQGGGQRQTRAVGPPPQPGLLGHQALTPDRFFPPSPAVGALQTVEAEGGLSHS